MRVLAIAALLASAVCACRRGQPEITAAPEKERPREAPVPEKPKETVETLIGHVGDEVAIEGRVVKGKPKILTSVAGKRPVIVDADGSHLPIVCYVTEPPDCSETVRMTGKVIVAAGVARSGTTEGAYAEPQLDVAHWACR